MFFPDRDRTPYSPDQKEFLERAWPCVSGAYVPKTLGRLSVRITPSYVGDSVSLETSDLCWMTNSALDLLDHRSILDEAYGDVLLTGLGLGVGVLFCEANPLVTSITVIEYDQDMIDLILPMIQSRVEKPFRVILADANAWEPDQTFQFAFLDHAEQDVPEATKIRLREHCKVVKNWWDVRMAQEASWQ